MAVHVLRDDELPLGAGTGAADVPVVPAASVIALRGSPLEVLLLRRREDSAYAPGAWVFPGGAVEPSDRRLAPAEMEAFRACAVRELFEESGIWIGSPLDDAPRQREALLRDPAVLASLWPQAIPAALVPAARWITPAGMPRRFDTVFFYARVPDATAACVHALEGDAALWITPADALERHAAGGFRLLFPTRRRLEALLAFRTPDQPMAARRGVEPRPVRPALRLEGGRKAIELPDDAD